MQWDISYMFFTCDDNDIYPYEETFLKFSGL